MLPQQPAVHQAMPCCMQHEPRPTAGTATEKPDENYSVIQHAKDGSQPGSSDGNCSYVPVADKHQTQSTQQRSHSSAQKGTQHTVKGCTGNETAYVTTSWFLQSSVPFTGTPVTAWELLMAHCTHTQGCQNQQQTTW